MLHATTTGSQSFSVLSCCQAGFFSSDRLDIARLCYLKTVYPTDIRRKFHEFAWYNTYFSTRAFEKLVFSLRNTSRMVSPIIEYWKYSTLSLIINDYFTQIRTCMNNIKGRYFYTCHRSIHPYNVSPQFVAHIIKSHYSVYGQIYSLIHQVLPET